MDGMDTVKLVRANMSEATVLAKNGAKSTAYACMENAYKTLENYLNQAKGPDYGFEGNAKKPKGKRNRG